MVQYLKIYNLGNVSGETLAELRIEKLEDIDVCVCVCVKKWEF